jgi:hypothetical protein
MSAAETVDSPFHFRPLEVLGLVRLTAAADGDIGFGQRILVRGLEVLGGEHGHGEGSSGFGRRRIGRGL